MEDQDTDVDLRQLERIELTLKSECAEDGGFRIEPPVRIEKLSGSQHGKADMSIAWIDPNSGNLELVRSDGGEIYKVHTDELRHSGIELNVLRAEAPKNRGVYRRLTAITTATAAAIALGLAALSHAVSRPQIAEASPLKDRQSEAAPADPHPDTER